MSYLFDQRIEKRQSDINGELEVSMSRGRFRLDANKATYSFEDLYSNFSRSFMHLDIGNSRMEKVLILGFGLGSIPLMLEDIFQQDAAYIGVEIDDQVLEMARRYLGETILNKVDLVCQDASTFVQDDSEIYDIIAVDLFINDKTPVKFREASFLQNIERLLAPNGILLYNTLTDNEEQERESQDFFQGAFLQVFENAYGYQLAGNTMLIADRRENIESDSLNPQD